MNPAAQLPPRSAWQALVSLSIAEDCAGGDVTTSLVISEDAEGRARIEAREHLVVCGVAVVQEVFRQVDQRLRCEAQRRDGETVRAGEILVTLTGPMRAILTGERIALNFLARLCGISSLTRRFVEAVAGTRANIVDTRKTTPGWRLLEKYATGVGGALRHRTSLSDGILLKDNHIAAAGGVEPAVKAALLAAPAHLRVQVEVQSEAEAALAIAGGVDFLLIDNCAPEEVGRIAGRWGDRVLLEASGGIDLSNAVAYAETGVHRLSIGALTHSAKGSDVALEIEPGGVAG